MHFSTPRVLFAAIVAGAFHTVTASAIPSPPFPGNPNLSLEGRSTGKDTVLYDSVPTATLKFNYERSHFATDHNKQRLRHQARGTQFHRGKEFPPGDTGRGSEPTGPASRASRLWSTIRSSIFRSKPKPSKPRGPARPKRR
ncbi:hypothetical protein BC835DRAFT_1421178 [Cytidiella melzeri]|nr:hypothetical protein BC835DRAFT_1421178 [Cytidiella melzeri]